MDYQNVHLTAAELFDSGHPVHRSLIHPGFFAHEWRRARLTAAFAPFDHEADPHVEVHVHRGLPDASLPGYARNLAQKAHWECSSPYLVQVNHRPLRYRKLQEWPSRGRIDPHSGREKGIDIEGGKRQLRTMPTSWNTRMDEAALRASIDHSDFG